MKTHYKTPEELQAACDAYFAKCGPVRPSADGLARSLGYASRQSLYDLEKRSPDFASVIGRARLQIQVHLAGGLAFRDFLLRLQDQASAILQMETRKEVES